jgi:hypothetical protein
MNVILMSFDGGLLSSFCVGIEDKQDTLSSVELRSIKSILSAYRRRLLFVSVACVLNSVFYFLV